MKKIERNIVINASVEQTFSYVSDTPNLVEIWPSMQEVKDLQPLPEGGKRFTWVYKMAGLRLQGVSEDEEWVENRRIVSKTKGGIESTVSWDFEAAGDATKLSFVAAYNVPLPLIGRLAETILVKVNEQEIEVMLTYLKTKVEWLSQSRQIRPTRRRENREQG